VAVVKIAQRVVTSALRLKWSLQHLASSKVLFDGVSKAWLQTGTGVSA
jgi:hypothetical protein